VFVSCAGGLEFKSGPIKSYAELQIASTFMQASINAQQFKFPIETVKQADL